MYENNIIKLILSLHTDTNTHILMLVGNFLYMENYLKETRNEEVNFHENISYKYMEDDFHLDGYLCSSFFCTFGL